MYYLGTLSHVGHYTSCRNTKPLRQIHQKLKHLCHFLLSEKADSVQKSTNVFFKNTIRTKNLKTKVLLGLIKGSRCYENLKYVINVSLDGAEPLISDALKSVVIVN